ncbi:MAG: SMP-30/gluconolactonase/LRE family protein [Planctomycetales bacterium]|nr:SMP-30/gluconolactonase/LRE family protein [Planctomycetales bacterium]
MEHDQRQSVGLFSCLVVLVAGVSNYSHAQSVESVTLPNAPLELVSSDFKFTEGPTSDPHGNVYFTDQPNDRIVRWDAETGKLQDWLKPAGRSNGLFFKADGEILACADEFNQLWSIAPDKTHQVLLENYDGLLMNGPNDVWYDEKRFAYFTDPYYRRPYWTRENQSSMLPQRVYRIDLSTSQVVVAADEFRQPNGIIGDADKHLLYVADIGDQKTYRFRIDEQGNLVDRELFCDQGSDGMTIDQEGNVYLTGREGVTVFDVRGDKRQLIKVPKNWTANVCFGGQDGKTLFVTASDSIFKIRMRVAGQVLVTQP